MVTSDFPNGVTSFGVPQLGGGEIPANGGNYFWVDSGASGQGDGTYEAPYTTLDYAVGQCTANNGDVIIVKAGHAESLTADSAVDIDIAGITVIGLGTGDDRPTFTFTTAVAADFKLAADNVTIKNLLFKAGIDALTGPIEVSADDCAIINCEYQDDATNNYETTDVLVTTSTPLRLLVDGFKYVLDGGAGGTQNQSVIQLNGADNAIIRNCWLVADSGTGVIEDATTSDQILIENCTIENSEASPTPAITATATTTGSVVRCNLRIASGTTYVTATTDLQYFETFGTGTDNTAGEKVGTILAGDLEGLIGSTNSTTTDSLHGKLGTDTELADNSIFDLLGGSGFASYPAAAAPANAVSIAEVIRAIYDRQLGDGTDAGANSILGTRVTKTGVVSAADDLFTVSGACMVKAMYGIVSTLVAGGTAPEILVNVKDAGNTPISASTVITDDAVGTVYWVMGDPGATFNGGDAPVVGFAGNNGQPNSGFLVNDITIESTPGGTLAATAGAIDWVIFYIPLEDSASITAAA